ncbi:MAG: hypothetical protein H0W49_01255 [Nitrospirales bacterium]|nr:hypothetical protein [Nitrospirales bacterium]MBA3964630.1 hypothetical protein [Nitrospirales bacterium]
MTVRIGCEARLKALMGGAQRWGMWLLAKSCLHYRPILPFDESLIVGLAGAGFGEVDQQLSQSS